MKPAMRLHNSRRLDDGSIDFDFYRDRAISLRAQAMRDALAFVGEFKFLPAARALIARVVVAAMKPARSL